MRLERKYEAEAAHQLSAGVPEGHQCRRLHGHRYIITVTLIGDIDPSTGMLLEYAEVDARVAMVLRFVDHNFLNHLGEDSAVGNDPTVYAPIVTGLPAAPVLEPELAAKVRANSTVENLAVWFLAELKHHFPVKNRKVGPLSFLDPQVYAVRIEEDSRSAVEA